MMYFTFFFTITLLIYALFVMKEERGRRMKRRIAQLSESEIDFEPQEAQEQKKDMSILKRIFNHVWKEFKKSFERRLPDQKEAKIELKLLQAGNPLNMTAVDFRILQISLFLVLPSLFGLYATILRLGIGGKLGFIILGLIVALSVPHYYIQMKIKRRSKKGLKELPDVLDLLTVSLEAGLGFDSALSKLVSKKDGVLTQEFQRCLEEIRLGRTRREALQGVRERLVLDEMRIFISSILQAEKLGIGMVQVMRVQSHEVREQRKQRAEEAAMKAPIKMLFPLVLFIFPSLFIVLLGPALIQFIQTFAK
jgi:tight adherence protein C